MESDAAAEDNSSDEKDESGNGKMSRSERKRMWRKNLSVDKLQKLRERDALRKRVERMNMSAEKRRDLRTKDTARKAALRRERRMTEGGTSAPPTEPVREGDSARGERGFGRAQENSGERSGRQQTSGRQRATKPDSQHSGSRRPGYTKIPVHTLLN